MQPYKLYDDPLHIYGAMLEDIAKARSYVYIETYKFRNDSIGDRFRELLIKKAKEGVQINLLIDSWGSYVSREYFSELIKSGGKVRFFTKVKFFIDFFTKNHRRNHRKFMLIDDSITYIGSVNITDYNIRWRELVLRLEGSIALAFKRVFNLDWRIYNTYLFEKNTYIRLIRHGDFEIVRDVPSIAKKRINKRFIRLIKNASREVYIETPYFLPGYFLRRAMIEACERNVKVTVLIPRHSDVRLVDILRNKYLGPLYESGVRFLYYMPTNLHGKALLVDNQVFSIGSPNFDYRSFRYMHEIVLIGKEESIVTQLREHIAQTEKDCAPFDYEVWTHRPRFQKFAEWLLLPFRHLL